MRIIIEEHQYPAGIVKDVLAGITSLRDIEGKVSVNYVGYYYNPTLRDTVFILPKVVLGKKLDDEGKEIVNSPAEYVFGKYEPENIINLDKDNVKDLLDKNEHDFLYELSVWIYRAIVVFRDNNLDSSIVLQQNVQQMSKGRLQKCNTFLDILLALQKFNRENQDFFFFILKNIHSGYNKINWNKTISHSQAFIQDGTPIYLNPVNKKKKINFDEELLIIFFSILSYINEHYGFPVKINVNFPLIKGAMFENYRKGMGKVRLMQIKYKYFSDKALYLWELCYAFFDQSKKINVETDDKEYLLVKNFNIVFEAIIDELIGNRNLPAGLKDQGDGKRVDHMYQYRDLTNNEEEKPIYYIGDSKYYKRNHPIGEESIYKQFTYARNVIQWNLDLFNDGKEEEQKGHLKLRDDVTEGYNIIPNFFISAEQNTLDRSQDIKLTTNAKKYFDSRQFDNRLFDRDSFLVAHYDVNFLFVVALYGRNNSSEKRAWEKKVKEMFRTEIQTMLEDKFDFYAITAREGVSAVSYIEEHFQQLLGKIFTPYADRERQKYYSVALDKREEYKEENDALLGQLESSFYVKQCLNAEGKTQMDIDPKTILPKVEPMAVYAKPNIFLTHHWLENNMDKQIVVGCYHDQAHLDWILGKNDRGTLIYNIRLGKDREGAQSENSLSKRIVSFAIIYEQGKEHENKYRVFRVHHHATMTKERILESWYPPRDESVSPMSNKYFCYVFDEEVTLGEIDINNLISKERITLMENFKEGAPIFKTGKELMEFRK